MGPTLIVLVLFVGVALRAMSADERTRLLQRIRADVQQLMELAARRREGSPPFQQIVRARARTAPFTTAVAALNATMFLFMIFGRGSLSQPETLIAWGASVGPRTTNGEWWRLVTASFVHSGFLQLLVNTAALLQLGAIVEPLVGYAALGALYGGAAVLAGLVSLWQAPIAVTSGAAGGITGIYGLLLALLLGGWLRSSITIPLAALKRLGPAAVLFGFALYHSVGGGLSGAAALTAAVAGFLCGLALVVGVADRQGSPGRRVGAIVAVTAVIAFVSAVSLRGITDVKPEMERVVAIEDRTAGEYREAFDRFQKDRTPADRLAKLIEETIMAELRGAQTRLTTLERVPPEHQQIVADAGEFLQLRYESWRLRAEGLRKINRVVDDPALQTWADWRRRAASQHKTNMLTLGKADATERAALDTLQRLKESSPLRDPR